MNISEFFTLGNQAFMIFGAFIVGAVVEGIKSTFFKISGRKIRDIFLVFIPFFVAVPVFCAWSMYFNEGVIIWSQASLLVVAWGASSSFIYRWGIKQFSNRGQA